MNQSGAVPKHLSGIAQKFLFLLLHLDKLNDSVRLFFVWFTIRGDGLSKEGYGNPLNVH
jgi:hypothetical protein